MLIRAIDPNGVLQNLQCDAQNQLKVTGAGGGGGGTTPAGTSTLTNVAASGSSVTLLSANAGRLGFVLYNDSSSAVDVKLGAVASATSFTKRLLPNEAWDSADLGANYTGRIDAIWDSAVGTMRVTELTA